MVTVLNWNHASVKRNTAADLLLIKIGSGGAIFDLPHTGGRTCKVEKCFCQYGFASAAVRCDDNVTNGLGRILFHANEFLLFTR